MKYKTRIIVALIIVLFLSIFLQVNRKEGYENNPVIPLNIYQTWETKDMPEKMRENVERLKSQNPEFIHYLFDADDRRKFIQENFEEDVLKAYDKIIPGAYKADLWRYCVLYIKGGIYLDIKYSNVDNFKLIQLTDAEYFVPDIDDSGGGIYNAFMICKSRNRIMREAISRVVKNVKEEYYGDSGLFPTGPMLLKSCFSADEFEKAKKNGLSVCRYNENTSVCLNNNPILTVYAEYYKSERAMSSQAPYYELWGKKQIYNK
jgi:mannosyltransferase OCH1-like enzyme